LIAAVAAPPRSEYSPATIDILVAASLYSLLVGNDDVAVELFSRIDSAHVPDERADRLARFAWMADTHHRYQQWVRRGAGLVAGGENLDVTERRTIGIVEASPQLVVFRDRGVNRRYPCELLPTDVGLALAQRAGANPDQLRSLRAAELVVDEARLAFRGKAIDLDQLLGEVGKLRTGGSESGDLDLVDEFCRLDLDALARSAPRPTLWTEVEDDGSDWLAPLDDVPLANRAFAALASAVDATEPGAQATLYHFAIDQLFSGGDEAVGLAISVPTGQFADPSGRSSLLAKIKLDRTNEPQARAIVRVLLDRIQNAQADGRMTLVRICRQVISKFELESYQTLLDQITAN
jgi:hypothetical protein